MTQHPTTEPGLPAPGARPENLTRDEARARADRLRVDHTEVALDLTTGATTFRSVARISFEVTTPGPTFVDLTAVEVHHVRLDGRDLDLGAVVAPTRLELPALTTGPHHLEVAASMAYQHEGKGLHRFVDPSDDRVYLHSQFEPFDAHLVYACFDQPDLKTTFGLTVDAPAGWVVVSNSRTVEQPDDGQAGTWRFAPTPRISTYITAVVAGGYTFVTDRYVRDDGSELELRWFVRRSLASYLDPDELFEVTRQGLAAFERLFEQPYPFDSYDQLLVPEFSAGAMENPGCITFSEAYVFRSKVTDATRERRAETILHEMAHMWFGDLVTMRWWDDLWLNESFATFMAVLVQATSTRWSDAWVTFLDAEKAWAVYQDQLPSTHPVADEMPDVESVHQNFDGITYAKGASVLRQLVAWVGEDAFLAGCRDYFARHAWGSTELADFLAALERASGRDLAAWRDEWLLTTGVTSLHAEVQVDADGLVSDAAVVQTAETPSWATGGQAATATPAPRRHRLAVGLYTAGEAGLSRAHRVELDVTGERTPLPELIGHPAPDLVLVNDDDLTYAKTTLDAGSTQVVLDGLGRIVAPLPRALVWSTAWNMVRDARLPARRYTELVRRHIAAEGQVGALQRLLQRAEAAAERYGDPASRADRLHELAHRARAGLDAADHGTGIQLAWARHWAGVARGDADELRAVGELLAGDRSVEGLELDTDLRWHLVISLARAGAIEPERIDAELARDATDLGERQAATAYAALPGAATKQAAWDRLLSDTTLSHTMSRQIWTGWSQLDQEQVLAPYVDRYLEVLPQVWAERSLDWAIGFTAAMFPHHAAGDGLIARLDELLATSTLQRPLRRVLLEQRDLLVRTVAARTLDAEAG